MIASSPAVPDGQTVTFYNGKTKLRTGTTTKGVATLSASFAKTGTPQEKLWYRKAGSESMNHFSFTPLRTWCL